MQPASALLSTPNESTANIPLLSPSEPSAFPSANFGLALAEHVSTTEETALLAITRPQTLQHSELSVPVAMDLQRGGTAKHGTDSFKIGASENETTVEPVLFLPAVNHLDHITSPNSPSSSSPISSRDVAGKNESEGKVKESTSKHHDADFPHTLDAAVTPSSVASGITSSFVGREAPCSIAMPMASTETNSKRLSAVGMSSGVRVYQGSLTSEDIDKTGEFDNVVAGAGTVDTSANEAESAAVKSGGVPEAVREVFKEKGIPPVVIARAGYTPSPATQSAGTGSKSDERSNIGSSSLLDGDLDVHSGISTPLAVQALTHPIPHQPYAVLPDRHTSEPINTMFPSVGAGSLPHAQTTIGFDGPHTAGPDNLTATPALTHVPHAADVSVNPYQRMDQIQEGPPPVMTIGVNRMNVGLHDPSLGWVEVRTQTAAGQVAAALVTASSQTHQSLVAQLPSIAQFLSDREVRVNALTVEQHLSGEAGGNYGGAETEHRESPAGERNDAAAGSSTESMITPSSTGADVIIGVGPATYISVLA